MQRGRERDARVASFPRGEHPKRRVLGQPLRVVRVLIPSQTAIDRLTKQVGQRELAVASSAGIAEMPFDPRAQAEAFVEFPRKQEARIRCDCGTTELDAKLRVE